MQRIPTLTPKLLESVIIPQGQPMTTQQGLAAVCAMRVAQPEALTYIVRALTSEMVVGFVLGYLCCEHALELAALTAIAGTPAEIAASLKCQVPGCTEDAISTCDPCGRAICADHRRTFGSGDTSAQCDTVQCELCAEGR